MSDTDSIYGGFEEHPEFPIDDARRFTIKIREHRFVREAGERGCGRCGFPEVDPATRERTPMHPEMQ